MSLDLVNSALLLRETTLTNLPYAVGATTITVADSAEFEENFTAERHFHLVIWDKNQGGSPKSADDAGKLEIVKATTEPVANSIDIVRGQEGTAPIEFSSGGDWQVSLMFTPAVIKEAKSLIYLKVAKAGDTMTGDLLFSGVSSVGRISEGVLWNANNSSTTLTPTQTSLQEEFPIGVLWNANNSSTTLQAI